MIKEPQFINTLSQILNQDGTAVSVALIRYLRWQLFKLNNNFPNELLLSKSKIYKYQNKGVAPLIFFFGLYDYNNMMLLSRVMSNLKIDFIDIGANIGAYTLLTSEYNINVYSFEPHPKTFLKLQSNIHRNHRKNVSLFCKAVSDFSGITRFTDLNEGALNKIDKSGELLVNVIDLDSFISDSIIDNFILKIDVEGEEWSVIKGLNNHLDKSKIIMIEGGKKQVIVDYLNSNQFLGPYYYHEKRRAITNKRQNRPEDEIYINKTFITELLRMEINLDALRDQIDII